MGSRNDKRQETLPQVIGQLLPTNLKIFKAAEISGAEISQPKIPDSTIEEIKEALRYVFVLIGLYDIPEEVEKAVLLNHIYRNYKNYNTEDIRQAFELGIEDHLSIRPEEVVVQSFKKFSPAHFSKVMRAYKQYKANVLQEDRKALPMPDPYTPEVKAKLSLAYYNDIIMPMFWDYAESGLLNFGPARVVDVYNSLIEHGKISPTDEEKKKAYEKRKPKAGSKEKAVELAQRDIIQAYFDAEKVGLKRRDLIKIKQNYEIHKLNQKADVLQHKQSKRRRAEEPDGESSDPGANSI